MAVWTECDDQKTVDGHRMDMADGQFSEPEEMVWHG